MARLGRKLRSLEGGRVAFMCPGCRGMHQVGIGTGPGPRWGYNSDPDKPTFTPSVYVNAPGPYHTDAAPSCHSFVTEGRIQFLPDCTHALAGQTVDLPDLPEV